MKDEEATRTLLIADLPRGTTHDDLLAVCRACGDVRDHFVLQNKYSVFFVTFYDIRASAEAMRRLRGEGAGGGELTVRYTISRSEIPKGSDTCDESKHQSTLVVAHPTEEVEALIRGLSDASSVERKGSELVVTFFDTRKTLEYFQRIKKDSPRKLPRIAWDKDLRKRRTLLLAADETVKMASPGFFKGVGAEEQPKRHAAPEARKRVQRSVGSNWLLQLFDRFIGDHSEEIARLL